MNSNATAMSTSTDVECFQAKQPTRQPPPSPPRPKKRHPQRPKLTVDTHMARRFDLDETPIFLRQTAASSPRLHAAAAGLAPHLRQYATDFRDDVWIGPDSLQLELTSLPRFSSTVGAGPQEPEEAAEEEDEKPLPPPPPTRKCRLLVSFPSTPAPANYPFRTPGLSLSRQNSIQKTPDRFYFPPSQVPWADTDKVQFNPTTPHQHNPMKLVRKLTKYVRRTPSLEKELADVSDSSSSTGGSSCSSRSSPSSTRYQGSPISAARLGYVSPQLHRDLLPHPPLPQSLLPPPPAQPNQNPQLRAETRPRLPPPMPRQILRVQDPASPSTERFFASIVPAANVAAAPAPPPEDPIKWLVDHHMQESGPEPPFVMSPWSPWSPWSPLPPPRPLLPALSPRSPGRVETVAGGTDADVDVDADAEVEAGQGKGRSSGSGSRGFLARLRARSGGMRKGKAKRMPLASVAGMRVGIE